jgi:hypothetical protein
LILGGFYFQRGALSGKQSCRGHNKQETTLSECGFIFADALKVILSYVDGKVKPDAGASWFLIFRREPCQEL